MTSHPKHGLRTCILILGMHRSGTSALSKVTNFMGASLPASLLPGGVGNTKGHWESNVLLKYNNTLLKEFRSVWHDWLPLDIESCSDKRRAEIKVEIQEKIAAEFGQAPLIVVKDPRICRFASLFIEALEDAQFKVHPVFIFRNPLEVCASLQARDDMASTDIALLWLRHTLDAHQAIQGRAHTICSYNSLLQDWEPIMKATFDKVAPEALQDIESKRKKIESFLTEKDRHHAHTTQDIIDNPLTQRWITDTYEQLTLLEKKPTSKPAASKLSKISKDFDAACKGFHPIYNALKVENLSAQDALKEKIETQNKSFIALEHTVSELQSAAKATSKRHNVERTSWKEKTAQLKQDQLNLQKSLQLDLQHSLQLKDAEIAEIETTLQQERSEAQNVKTELDTARSKLQQSHEALVNVRQKLTKEHDILRDTKTQLDMVHSELHLKTTQLSAAQRSLEDTKNSTSWKITGPLRQIKQLFFVKGAIRHLLYHLARNIYRSLPLPYRFKQTLRSKIVRQQIFPTHDKDTPFTPTRPLVSVVVPNYNHADFLRQRLESIYNQSYQNFEVILLDDCSKDTSVEILEEYAARYPDKTRLIVNKKNSGSPFPQWAKGIDIAKGTLIWIAESDDFCDYDFLEQVVPAFDNESVQLAYGDIQFADEKNTILHGLDDYRRSTGKDNWRTAYTHSATSEFSGPFGIKNIVPNASGAVFRKPYLPQTFVNYLSEFKVCGDWVFYMFCARGGQISFVPKTRSYFRQHTLNTSVTSFETEQYYHEHQKVLLNLRKYYNVSDEIVVANARSVEGTYAHHVGKKGSAFPLESVFDPTKAIPQGDRPLNILIASLGFYLGGGELLPIHLANELYRRGHTVTFFALGYEVAEETGVRLMLDAGIPVLRPADFSKNPNLVSDFDFDIINSHNIGLEYFFSDLGFDPSNKAKYFVTHHGSYEVSEALPEHLRSFNRFVEHWIYLAEKNLTALKRAGVDLLNKTKFPNGLPPNTRPDTLPSRTDIGIPEDSFVCTIVTRALPEKGWMQAIEAVRQANEFSDKDIYLLLIGNGPVYDTLKETELPPFIKLLGYKKDGAKYYHLSDVGLLPTYFHGESYPLTMIECLQASKPCIATDVGEIREILTDSTGQIAGTVIPKRKQDVDLVDNLKTAILSSANNKKEFAKKISTAAEMSSKYDIENLAKLYEQIFISKMQ